ncbi:unnamed protein product [Anisakis simplex]|uniref:Mic1 domain-containing protein n=1 Tax=Anisakis simplex TaxID=6269 RepID=A0A0M3K2K3_ANISI|nr:unnamed protein product [Anisakis simplex]
MSITITRSDRVMSEYRGEIPLYSPSWVIFTPNLIVDASIGIFSTISMYPESAESSFVNQLFATIVEPYAQRLIAPLKYNEGINKYTLVADAYEPLVIDQSDMFRGVFLPANESATIDKQQFIQTMLHYLLCLQENNIDVEPYFLNEILVPTMVNAGELNRLQQLLHYRVIPDAKQLVRAFDIIAVLSNTIGYKRSYSELIGFVNRKAFQLLSYEAKHAPLIQLAVDMLARLGTAAEEIVEVLLSRGQLIDAIRFLDSLSPSEKVNSMKLIEHAWKQNRQIRFAVFSYFQNHTTRSTYNNFTNSEQYDDYLRRFKTLFTNDELEVAKRDSQFGVVVPE